MTELADIDIASLKADFPIFESREGEKSLVYLDSSATTQKPRCVIDAVSNYYAKMNANVHRGVYRLSEEATAAYETARQNVRNTINAKANSEVIFTKGTTESINLIANSFSVDHLSAGDEVLLTGMEHHSSIVPWQMACERTGAHLTVVPVLDNGTLDMEAYKKLLTEKTKIVNIIHVSNVLGTINPVKQMIAMAHEKNIPVVIDGAQAMAHVPVDVQELDCEFYAFSAHKLYGPTGVGVLYGKQEWLEKLPPYQLGGDMIRTVSFDHTEFNVLPHKFEAGTPNIAGVIGLGAAIEYFDRIDNERLMAHEQELTTYALAQLRTLPGINFIGQAEDRIGVISFTMDQAHPHDIGTILSDENIAIRVGHHCAMPLMERFSVPATARASFGIYNSQEDVDALIMGLRKVIDWFGKH